MAQRHTLALPPVACHGNAALSSNIRALCSHVTCMAGSNMGRHEGFSLPTHLPGVMITGPPVSVQEVHAHSCMLTRVHNDRGGSNNDIE